MTQSERFEAVRKAAMEVLEIPREALEIKTSTFAWQTEFGPVKVAITAIKDTNFNIEDEAEAFRLEREEARVKAEARHAAAEAKRRK